ncbi:aldolase [Streptomyces sp. DT2A-34]|uniref:3-oxo-tetronate 4-phosphate decarboxylase n=1 Tax=Streptomyces sp. DT2A-34 TaxID=3051182 RepID=UPI00265BD5AA|nr:3-oxo-tetronate 4-phosphate decarboxylase [Streptomyces sp. DT2A-34]MDO0916648.1 aldolase [Streptomyces sp. DT2A-34]
MSRTRFRRQITDLGASLFARGLSPGRTGNISVRTDDCILLTPTGASLGALEPEELSVLSLDGTHLDGPRPSKEAFLHLAMYRSRPADTAVVHLHSPYAVALSCLDPDDASDVLPPLTAYYALRVGTLPLLPYHAPGDERLGPIAAKSAQQHHALLLANHGPLAAGRDLAATADVIEELEATAKIHLVLRGMPTRPLTSEQLDTLHAGASQK